MYSIWTNSYVVINGKKIYLETSYSKLKRKMEDESDDIITLTRSGFVFGKKIKVPRSSIDWYGEAGI